MEFHEYELQSQAEAYGAELNTCREELCQYHEEVKQYQSEAQAAQSNGQEPAAPTSHQTPEGPSLVAGPPQFPHATICITGSGWGDTIEMVMQSLLSWKIDTMAVRKCSFNMDGDHWFIRFQTPEQAAAALTLLPNTHTAWAKNELSDSAPAKTGHHSDGCTLWFGELETETDQIIMQVIMQTGGSIILCTFHIF